MNRHPAGMSDADRPPQAAAPATPPGSRTSDNTAASSGTGSKSRDAAPRSGKPRAVELTRRWSAGLYRRLLFSAGIVFAIVGAIGLVVPMMPGTVFLILAAWCFTRSSPRFEHWLLTNRYLGPSVVQWRETGSIPAFAKVFAIASLVGSFILSWLLGAPDYVLAGLAVLFAAIGIFIVTRPTS